jgi:hypothetical protein
VAVAEVKNYGLSGVHRTLQLGKQGPVLVGNADTDSFTVTLQDAATLTTMGGANATDTAHFITKAQLDVVYTEAQFLANVNYNDTSPILLGNISSGTKTIITTFDVTTAFDANAVVTVGDSTNNSLLMSDDYAEIEVTGTYQTINTVEFASNTALNIYVTQGGATQGAGTILVSVVDGPVVNSGVINYDTGGTSGIALTDLSVTSNSPSGNGSLTYNDTTGVFTFTPASVSQGIALSNISVTSNSPSGNGSLTYSNTTGVFTFTPANLSSVAGNYGNSNVVTLLSSFGSNTIFTSGNVTTGILRSTASIFGSVDVVLGDTANASAAKTRLVSFDTSSYIQTGNGTIGSTGNIVFSPYSSADQRVVINTASGNITSSGKFIGDGSALTNVTVSVAGNIVGTSQNVSLVAGSNTWSFNNTGNLVLPGNTFAINYANNTPVNVVTRFEGSWTVPVGNSTQSFTVTPNETYYMWVDCNIPNGIITWNATATITNTNVPVVGAQYAWVYNGGGSPIDFTSIPNQFVGTSNTIVRSSVAPSATTNRFDFGFNNTSGGSVTVRYGWIAIS